MVSANEICNKHYEKGLKRKKREKKDFRKRTKIVIYLSISVILTNVSTDDVIYILSNYMVYTCLINKQRTITTLYMTY